MNKYFKEFLHRGMVFGGFGPIITGIVFYIISLSVEDFSMGGGQILLAIVSTYLLAFIHAGASVFNQIDHWPIAKSLAVHFATLYFIYIICYVLNSWIPFEPMVIVIFTAVFAIGYFVIWFIVYFSVKASAKRLNSNLKSNKIE